uniref:Capsid protein n=1 Tax=Diporeia sp. associated circular virus TaxID=1299317 RepID=M1STN6_9VIRU|nr:hypothetical protein [Diporeia sp. associated circular virus]
MYSSLFHMFDDASQFASMSSQSMSSQQGAAKRARTMKSQAEGGVPASVSSNKVCLAQFNPGRGAELSWTSQNLLKSIKFKTGEAVGPVLKDSYAADRRLYQGQKVSMGFAYKAVLDASFIQGNDVVPTRFRVHNVFRHTNYASRGHSFPSPYSSGSILWNDTLGPDSSFVRQAPPNGSAHNAAALAAAGFATDLVSAMRAPLAGSMMYSRMNRQDIENFSWNSHPMKIAYVQPSTATTLSTNALEVYANSTNDPTGVNFESMPYQQLANFGGPAPPPITPDNNHGYYYKVQAKPGHVAYQFNNDGTSPIVIDVVVTRVKKGMEVDLLPNNILESAYATGYLNMMNANQGQQSYAGQTTLAGDCINNARVEFLPAKALKYQTPQVLNQTTDMFNGPKGCPFKQVARDQFVVSGGATRPWSMDFQSLCYNANDYSQRPGEANLPPGKDADDLTYILSIGFSTLAVPLAEIGNGGQSAIVDRVAQSLNCSVTGVYTENPEPVVLSRSLKLTQVDGAVDHPWYQDAQAVLPILQGVDIANAGNIIRSQTNASALISVGPFTTLSGA